MTRFTSLEFSLLIAATAAIFTFVLSFITRSLAWNYGFLDQPKGERKIHHRPTPYLGGLAIACSVILLTCLALPALGVFREGGPRLNQLIGFVMGLILLIIGGMFDDYHPLPARTQIVFPILAALCVILGGTGIVQTTRLIGHGGWSLVWWQQSLQLGSWSLTLSLPSDIVTFVWLLLATYATKVLDGLDGLVTGITIIGAGLVGVLSLSVAFFQPTIALFAAIIGGSFLGFLPHNIHPAKQFLGEEGSTIAGFSLGFLAILSSAKIAIALAVLAIPIADAIFVVIGRIHRGVPWYRGDDTHLHFRLLRAGISHRVTVFLLWGISLLAGISALSLQTRGKYFLISGLIVLTALASYVAGTKQRRP